MVPSEIESNAETVPKKNRKKKKDSVDKEEFKINMNPWGLAFMILFVAVLGYLMIGAMASLPPFEYNLVTEEYEILEGLLSALLVIALIFLGLGVYFGWIKKPIEEEIEDEEETQEDIDQMEYETKKTDRQITFVYVDDEKTEE